MIFKLKQVTELKNDIEIILKYKNYNNKVSRSVSQIKLYDRTILASNTKDKTFIDAMDIMYFDSVDNVVYAMTENEALKTELKLYEIEENFKDSDFIRINKSVIINMSKIKTLRPLLNSKIEVTFSNNEKQIVTRSYIKAFKKMLNL